MSEYLFVCGTLRKDFVTQTPPEIKALMQSLPFIAKGQVQGQLYDLGEFPGAILSESLPTKIIGEVYEVPHPNETFATLDEYEGFIPGELEASLFARVKTTVSADNGNEYLCWMYVYNDWVLNGTLIESGDYVIWKSER